MREEIEEKMKELDEFMQLHEERQSLNEDFHFLIKEVGVHFKTYDQSLRSVNQQCQLLQNLVKEMELGVEGDYRMKEGLIEKSQSSLDDIWKELRKLNYLAENLDLAKMQEEYRKGNKDIHELQANIKAMTEMQEQVE